MIEKHVAVVAFQGISPFHLSVSSVVFGEDPSEKGILSYHVRVCAVEPGSIKTSAGYSIMLEQGLTALESADMIILPSWNLAESPPKRLISAILAAHRRGAVIVGLCLGAFVLASTGLLDGRRATTHWRYAADLARQYPGVQIDANVLWVDHGDVVTSAGAVASLDCALHLLGKDGGVDVANRVARRLVIAANRSGGHAQVVERPVEQMDDPSPMHMVMEWMLTHLDWAITVEYLAQKANYSRRHFTREFRAMTGTSPLQWLLTQRLKYARVLLETTSLGVSEIADRCGFGSQSSFRRHFLNSFGTNPRDYRRGFNRGTRAVD